VNYYPHHIGDFNNATRHLTRVERALYRELIELYYDTERPLPADDFPWICKKVLADSQTDRDAVKAILKEFFDLEGDVYRHRRCDREIASYRAKQEAAIKAGRASAESRLNRKGTRVQRTLNRRSTSVQPTNNQEPRTIVEAPQRSRGSRLPSDWEPDQELKAWASTERPDLDFDVTLARFRDYWAAIPGGRGVKLDWPATFRNWVRQEKSVGLPQREKFKVDA
jgi:uncharacterized protein YdaU (DUF1376 family)